MISFELRVGKAQTDQTTSEFAVIIPKKKKKNESVIECVHGSFISQHSL